MEEGREGGKEIRKAGRGSREGGEINPGPLE